MIKLTGNYGSVYIDPTKVIGIETTRYGESRIYLSQSCESIIAKETPDEIVEIINKIEK